MFKLILCAFLFVHLNIYAAYQPDVSATIINSVSSPVPVNIVSGSIVVNSVVSGSISVNNFPATLATTTNQALQTSRLNSIDATLATYLPSIDSNTSTFYSLTNTQLRADHLNVSSTILGQPLFSIGGVSTTSALPVTGSFFQTTQPVSLAALSLTGVSTTNTLIVSGTVGITPNQTVLTGLGSLTSLSGVSTTAIVNSSLLGVSTTSILNTSIQGVSTTANFNGSITGVSTTTALPTTISGQPLFSLGAVSTTGTLGVTGTFFQGTQPVSLAALSLTGVSTTNLVSTSILGVSTTSLLNTSLLGVSTTASLNVAQGTATNLKTQAENYQGGSAVAAANPLFVSIAGVSSSGVLNSSISGVSTTATLNVGQATGTNLHTVLDSGLVSINGVSTTAILNSSLLGVSTTSILNTSVQGVSTTSVLNAANFQAGSAVGSANPLWIGIGSVSTTTALPVTFNAASFSIAGVSTTAALNNVISGVSTTALLNTSILGVSTTSALNVTNATATNLKVQAENYQAGTAVGGANPLFVSIAGVSTTGMLNNSITAVSTTGVLNVSGTVAGLNPAASISSWPVTGIDSTNSTTAALTGNATFTGAYYDAAKYSNVTVNVSTDVTSAADGLKLQYSSDGTNLDSQDVYTIPAGSGAQYSAVIGTRYFRVVYVNGAGAQSAFRLQTKYHVAGIKPSSVRLIDSQSDQSDVPIEKAVLAGVSGTSTVNLISANNALLVSGTNISPDFTSSASVSSTEAINANFTLRLANTSRIGLEVMNTTDATCWLRFSTSAATSSTMSVMLLPNGYYNMVDPIYTGQINAICSANGTTGKLNLTEKP